MSDDSPQTPQARERRKVPISGYWAARLAFFERERQKRRDRPLRFRPRCPVCGAKGYRRIERIGGEIIHWCRKGHPHYALNEDATV